MREKCQRMRWRSGGSQRQKEKGKERDTESGREGEGEKDGEWEGDKREGKRNIKSKIETEREKGTVKKKCDIL